MLTALLLIALKAYYVLVACAVGALLLWHRELVALVRRRRLPPVDERIRENLSRAMRNGLLFFGVAALVLLVISSLGMVGGANTVHAVGGLFIAVAAVYLGSYFYFERAAPNLRPADSMWLGRLLAVMAIALAVAVISLLLHNAFSALFGIEEPFFFILCVVVAPLAFVASTLGVLALCVKGLLSRGE